MVGEATAGDGSDRNRPRLVVVCGFPGVGKTTVAETVVERLDGTLLRTDVLRKEMTDDPDYTDEETREVYHRLLERSRTILEGGDSVVLDGTFFKRAFRERASEAADRAGAEFEVVRVRCDEPVVKDRIRQRQNGVSDADFEVYQLHKDIFEDLDRDHVTVDNSEDLDETRQQVLAHF